MLRLRALTGDEAAAIKRQAQSRTAAAREVERARIVWLASQGERVAAIARRLDLTAATVRLWIGRFNREGVAGLADKPRSGAPPTYPESRRGGDRRLAHQPDATRPAVRLLEP